MHSRRMACDGRQSVRGKRSGAGAVEVIRVAVGTCTLGCVLVAEGGRGIRAILPGDDAKSLRRELAECFPGVVAEEMAAGEAARSLARVADLVDDPGRGQDLPLDPQGTDFQLRVWAVLRGIPAGETCSYAEVARRMGRPKAVRAVARACAANCIAVAIPCHRVVRGDGVIGGYRWGVERKRELLRREGWRPVGQGGMS